MKKLLVSGGDGLLAQAFKEIAPRGFEVFYLGHTAFDLTRSGLMLQRLAELQPDVVINTAAYNLVDRCETERELSWSVNATGPETLAKLCADRNIRLVHFGTDYVFDGEKKVPYLETDTPNPINHYAAGKFAGERAVLCASPENLVLRTSWVFGWHPTQTKTYVHAVLKSALQRRLLKATTDQVSIPTFANDLARWTLDLLHCGTGGLFHAVNDEGVSRFDWTKIILDEAVRAKLIYDFPEVEPVLSSFFNSSMRRPDYTVMSNQKLSRRLGQPMGSWRIGLRKMLARMEGFRVA
jgi:dTDP-4-dehydrorhamnose reductase